MDQVDCVVVGAGVVGLAVARALALSGREVLLLEAMGAIGTGTSSRNSEVIHAGIYYPGGSHKARLCVQGGKMLYNYCLQRGINHRRCGKLIVATSADQVARLQGIIDKAVQLHGGLGVVEGTEVERLYREIRPLRIYEGTTEIQKLIIAKGVLDRAATKG